MAIDGLDTWNTYRCKGYRGGLVVVSILVVGPTQEDALVACGEEYEHLKLNWAAKQIKIGEKTAVVRYAL